MKKRQNKLIKREEKSIIELLAMVKCGEKISDEMIRDFRERIREQKKPQVADNKDPS